MTLEKDNAEEGDDGPELKAESGEELSNEGTGGDGSCSRKGGVARKENLQPVVKLVRIVSTGQKAVASPSTASTNTRPATVIAGGTKEDSGTDTEDEGWEKPNFKDKDWFIRESHRCQTCNKSYSKPPDASLCVTSHKSIRCYLCFKVYSTTDILFKHFRRRHEQGNRENTLACPFCDQVIPYKSVSCHVISVHLKPKRATTASPSTAAGRSSNGNLSQRPSRSVSTDRLASSSKRNPPKRARKASTPPAPPPQMEKKRKQNRK